MELEGRSRKEYLESEDDTIQLVADEKQSLNIANCSLAIVARDHRGTLLTGHAKQSHAHSALEAECRAMEEALLLIQKLQITRAVVESDCKHLVDVCNGNRQNWCVNHIRSTIKELISNGIQIRIVWTNREGNLVAHTVAQLLAHNRLHKNWIFNPPSSLRALLRKDAAIADDNPST